MLRNTDSGETYGDRRDCLPMERCGTPLWLPPPVTVPTAEISYLRLCYPAA